MHVHPPKIERLRGTCARAHPYSGIRMRGACAHVLPSNAQGYGEHVHVRIPVVSELWPETFISSRIRSKASRQRGKRSPQLQFLRFTVCLVGSHLHTKHHAREGVASPVKSPNVAVTRCRHSTVRPLSSRIFQSTQKSICGSYGITVAPHLFMDNTVALWLRIYLWIIRLYCGSAGSRV